MTTNSPTTISIPSPLDRVGMPVQRSVLSSGASHFHIPAPDDQSSLVLAVPISLADNSGVAHVLEHLLLTGDEGCGNDSLFFRTRAASNAVDMNAVTNSRYLAVHFTCRDFGEYVRLLETFTAALLESDWNADQLARETETISNEMLGAFSNRQFFWLLRSYQALFIAGSARFNPGGDPDQIAAVTLEKLQQFWRNHFSPASLIAISYGSVSCEHVQRALELSLSRFDFPRQRHVLPSLPSKKPRDSHLAEATELSEKISSAILVTPDGSSIRRIDVALLESFFMQYADAIVKVCGSAGIAFAVPPFVREIDTDFIVHAVCHPGDFRQSRRLWCEISDRCDAVIRNLSKTELTQLTQSALTGYFTLGNHKFGAGVAAAFELLGSVCHATDLEHSKTRILDSAEIQATIEEYSGACSWLTLVEKTIRSNPRQVLIVCDDSASSVDEQFSPADTTDLENQVSPAYSEDGNGSEKAAPVPAAMQRTNSHNRQWQDPKVSQSQLTTVYHYRLPRPWISSSKLLVPLPVEFARSPKSTEPLFLPTVLSCVASVLPPGFLAAANVLKTPGHRGYKLYLSLSNFAGIREMDKILELIDAVFSEQSLEQMSEAPVEQQSGKKILPLHKLAVYRSASHISDVAKIKLVLAGYVPDAHTGFPGNLRDIDFFTKLAQQPRALFLATAADVPECSINEPVAAINNHGAAEHIDENAGNTNYGVVGREYVSGQLNYCARVWTLDDRYGVDADEDAVPHVFAALATNQYLEPVLRGERHAYAASAEIDQEMGLLTMFSFRDPFIDETDALFCEAFQKIVTQECNAGAFENAKQRALSRLQNKGSYDQRCEQQFDRLVQGFEADYFSVLERAIKQFDLPVFRNRVSRYFKNARSAGYVLAGRDHGEPD